MKYLGLNYNSEKIEKKLLWNKHLNINKSKGINRFMYLNNIFYFNKYYNLNIYRKMYILFINPLLLNCAQVIILDYNLEKIINRQQKYFLSYNLLSIKKTMKLELLRLYGLSPLSAQWDFLKISYFIKIMRSKCFELNNFKNILLYEKKLCNNIILKHKQCGAFFRFCDVLA